MEGDKIIFMETHEDKTFTKQNWEDLSIAEQKFTDCTFVNCNLSKTTFISSEFNGCTFHNCDMSLMVLRKCSAKKIKLTSSKAIGINWSDTEGTFSIEAIDSNVSYSSFAGKPIRKAVFKGCKVHEVDFTQCNLTEADFTNADLHDTRFVNSDLTKADFSNATNYRIDPKINKVKGATFTMPEVMALLDSFGIVIK